VKAGGFWHIGRTHWSAWGARIRQGATTGHHHRASARHVGGLSRDLSKVLRFRPGCRLQRLSLHPWCLRCGALVLGIHILPSLGAKLMRHMLPCHAQFCYPRALLSHWNCSVAKSSPPCKGTNGASNVPSQKTPMLFRAAGCPERSQQVTTSAFP